jgi:hypothetical protein
MPVIPDGWGARLVDASGAEMFVAIEVTDDGPRVGFWADVEVLADLSDLSDLIAHLRRMELVLGEQSV